MSPRQSATSRYRETFLYRDRIAELEGLIARASPAQLTVDFGGWQVRRSRGPLRHASSVWPRDSLESRPLPDRIGSVERFYATAGLPPRFLVGPGAQPRGLEQALAARGYRRSQAVQVRTLSAEVVVDRSEGHAGGELRLTVGEGRPDATWLEGWAAAAGLPASAREAAAGLLDRVAVPSAFVTVAAAGQPVAFARGVAYGGWLGLDLLAATGPARRPDVGLAMAGALARWGADHDVEQVHVQVDRGDPAAVLATDLGGRVAFSYRFHERPLALVGRGPGR